MSYPDEQAFELDLTEEQRQSPDIDDWVELKRLGERIESDPLKRPLDETQVPREL